MARSVPDQIDFCDIRCSKWDQFELCDDTWLNKPTETYFNECYDKPGCLVYPDKELVDLCNVMVRQKALKYLEENKNPEECGCTNNEDL